MTKISRIPLSQTQWDTFLKNFWVGVALLRNETEAEKFFKDLLTPTEIKMFLKRLEIAQLLLAGKSYDFIKRELRVTNTTIASVNLWLHNGDGGLKNIAAQLLQKKKQEKRN